MVSKRTTYLLWFFFGWAGLHHVYLRRLNQAIVWFATLGGGLGVGWIRDFWRIPEYIKWSNEDKTLLKKHLKRYLSQEKVKYSYFRSFGMVAMGAIVSTALGALVPDFSEETLDSYILLLCVYVALLIVGNTLGIYLVANIGEFKCSLFYPFVGSLVIIPVLLFNGSRSMTTASSLTTWLTRSKGIQWRHISFPNKNCKEGKKPFYKIVFLYLVACSIWLVIVATGLYMNGSITLKEGEKYSVKEIVMNFTSSQQFQVLSQTIKIYYHSGFGRLWRDIYDSFDFWNKYSAYSVLGLPWTANQTQISKRCRTLLAQTHPDRIRNANEKLAAESKFVEIQRACSSLTKAHSQNPKKQDS